MNKYKGRNIFLTLTEKDMQADHHSYMVGLHYYVATIVLDLHLKYEPLSIVVGTDSEAAVHDRR